MSVFANKTAFLSCDGYYLRTFGIVIEYVSKIEC